MNRLALCQRAFSECGSSGTISTTVGQTGAQGRMTNWVDTAWNELQTKHDDWDFLRASRLLGSGCLFATVAGQKSYPLGTGAGTVGVAASAFTKWDEPTFRVMNTVSGINSETFLRPINFDAWRDSYMYGSQQNTQTRPIVIAFGPDKSVCLGPAGDGSYTVTGDYFIAPTAMATDTDTPTGLPAQFHMLIVYGAMISYGMFQSAQEVVQRGQSQYNRMMAQLELMYAPRMTLAGALA